MEEEWEVGQCCVDVSLIKHIKGTYCVPPAGAHCVESQGRKHSQTLSTSSSHSYSRLGLLTGVAL